MTQNRMLLRNNVMLALIIGASLFTGCSKDPAQGASSDDSIATEKRRKWFQQPTTPITPTTPTDPGTGTPTVTGNTATFTEIAFSNPELINPGRGAEQWHNANEVNVPTEGVNTQRLDVYYRFPWTNLEGATQGSYNWSYFDGLINSAISKKQKFSFGIMTLNPDGGGVSYNGGSSYYPQYLHNLMQAESVKDWLKNGVWVPNYNSANYQNRLLALHQAINAHLESGTYNGVPYKNAIGYIDIRGYGSWGEWHHGSLVDNVSEIPSGARATVASLKKIVDAHTQGFPNYHLVGMIAAFDANRLPMIMNPPDIGYYILTAKNAAGDVGWRRDQWGATDAYLSDYLENNNVTFNGVVLKDLIMNKWKTAPIVGEPPSWNDNNFAALENQVRLYHGSSFGNGNYGTTVNATISNNVRAASKAAGYRFKITTITAPQTITRGASFGVQTNWQNVGIAPTYENWNVVFELQDASNAVKWSGNSTKILKLFLPAASATATTDNFSVPTTVAAGTYKLVVRVKDPNNYRQNIQLAVNGKNADGSYTVFSSVIVN